MQDLTETSRLFEASSRLDSAAVVLGKLSNGEPLTSIDRNTLEWAGRFLSQVDWTAGDSAHLGALGNLTVQATAVRPTFYAALIGIERHLQQAGINREQDVVDFLRKLYQLLIRGGAQRKTKSALPIERLQLASTFLRELSQGLLVQITDNGLPRESDLLVDTSTAFCLRP